MAQEPQMTQCPQCGKSFPTTIKLCPDDGTVLEHESVTATQIGKVLDGKYRLDAFLSQGGMGGVYRATHVMLNKNVAVKLINPELVTSPEIVRRFQREARAATTLSHPNIVSVYDLGQTADGTLYIAMEFVDGQSLRSLIEKSGPLPLTRTLAIARQLTSALSVAHRHGIIHRDLKPHNVMLARTDDGQQLAKLVDFGIAKTFEEGTQLTIAGFMPGTPQYMSPEQAEGIAVDARSDLYSLGIVIYEMLTGVVPFSAPSLPSLLIKHIKEAPQPPSLKNPRVSIPPELEAITMRCLAKSPNDRFQTADELGAALDHVAANLPNATASMQATVLAAGQPSPAAAWNAATIPAAGAMDAATVPASSAMDAATVPATGAMNAATVAATPAAAIPAAATPSPAPTVKVQAPMDVRPSSDTRPTATAPPGPAAAPAPTSSKAAGPALVAALMAAAIGVFVYINYFSGRSSSPVPAASSAENRPASDAPATSPAMAAQAGQPAAPAPSPTESTAPVASSQPPAVPAEHPAVPAEQSTSAAPPRPTTAPGGSAAAPRAAAAAPARESVPAGRESVSSGKVGRGAASPSTPPAGSAVAPAAAPAARAPAAASPVQAAAPAAQAAPTAFPENPTVFFQCGGAPALCAQLRPAVADALEKAGLTSVRNAARADINVLAMVDIVDERVDRQFGNTFAVRNYSIEVTGEAPRLNEDVPMPPATSVSFDAKLGAERAVEKSRVVASDIVDRVKAFAKKKRGG